MRPLYSPTENNKFCAPEDPRETIAVNNCSIMLITPHILSLHKHIHNLFSFNLNQTVLILSIVIKSGQIYIL